MSNLIPKKHHELIAEYVAEIEVTLDHEDDDEMEEALDDLRVELAEGKPTHETLNAMMEQVSAWLDGNDDEPLENLHDRIRQIPKPTLSNQHSI